MKERKEKRNTDSGAEEKLPLKKRALRELLSWVWVILAFLFIHGTLVHGRVIPSASMEKTLQIGDHLLVSRFGYDAEIPFTGLHLNLWRSPKRQQIIIFHPPIPGQPDYVKRVIGMPGDSFEIRSGAIWINGRPLEEPYINGTPDPFVNLGPVVVPPDHYFVMGDNRNNSSDSRVWGFLPRANIIGTPLFVYMSIEGPGEVWEPGHLGERFGTYATVFVHPSTVRWKRLFVPF
ncbi:MAG: signal peptidase I [Acidobacteria bacterium]|nr:signal peptidase I [Acidobacteriota bacterium]